MSQAEAERRSPVSSRRSESKRFEGFRPVCLATHSLSLSLSLSFSLSLSLSLHLSKYFPTNFASNVSLFLLFRRCLLPCYLMSIIRTLSSLAASFSKRYSRYISTLMKFHWSSGLKSSDCKQRLYAVQSIRLENIDTNKLRKVDSTYES